MNKSSVSTGGLVVSAASLVPAVDWVMAGCHTPVPAAVSALVAGLLAAGIHAAYNHFNPDDESDAAPSAAPSAIVLPTAVNK